MEQAQEILSEPTSKFQEAVVNGHAKINGAVGKIHHDIEKQENIFLFIPNVIGTSSSCFFLPAADISVSL